MASNKLWSLILIAALAPASASALTLNATVTQQSLCAPSPLSSACTGTVVATFTNVPGGSGTVYAQLVRLVGGVSTNVKCINVRDTSLANRTATVGLNAGVANAQVKFSTQVGLNAGNGITCGQVPVAGITVSSSPVLFTR